VITHDASTEGDDEGMAEQTSIEGKMIKDPQAPKEQHDNICSEEDFCKGCKNFDVFFNSCKKAAYKTSIGGKKETINPRTNNTRWLLAIVGCASDTRPHPAPTDEQCRICSKTIRTKARKQVLRIIESIIVIYGTSTKTSAERINAYVCKELQSLRHSEKEERR
jgi:hypothetical protein